MIDYRRIWLTFPLDLKQFLFYTIYKVCKHSLYSINFIAPVYKHFDNPSYSTPTHKLREPVCIQRQNVDQTPQKVELVSITINFRQMI